MARQFIYHMAGLKKAYGAKKILEDIHLSFYPDAKIGILGPNGAGKSTVLKIMAGLDKEWTGEAWLAEGATLGYLPQEPQLDPTKTVFENVMEGVAHKKAIVDRYNELMMNYSDETADEGARLQDEIDAQSPLGEECTPLPEREDASAVEPNEPSEPSGERPLLSRGSQGEWVVFLQEQLNRHGHGLDPDGIFGGLTDAAVRAATLILVPALAVDRHGARLGRGAGFYDRTLALADPAAALVAVVRDDEILERLPAEPHDVPMTHALTPRRGLVELRESPGPPGGSST